MGDLSGDLAIAAAYVEDGFIALESKAGQYLVGPVMLLGRVPIIITRIPAFPSSSAPLSPSTAYSWTKAFHPPTVHPSSPRPPNYRS